MTETFSDLLDNADETCLKVGSLTPNTAALAQLLPALNSTHSSKMKNIEKRKRLEQERRQRNAETFVQLNDTNPSPQKRLWQNHLFSKPIKRNDEAREDDFAIRMSEKMFGEFTSSRQMVLRKPIPNEFFQIDCFAEMYSQTTGLKHLSSPTQSPTRPEAKRPKLEIPKNDAMIQEILRNVNIPDLIAPIEPTKKNANEGMKFKTAKANSASASNRSEAKIKTNEVASKTTETSIKSSSDRQKNVVRSAWGTDSLTDKDMAQLATLCKTPIMLSPITTRVNNNRQSRSEKEEDMPLSSKPIKLILKLDKARSSNKPFYTSIMVQDSIAQPMRMPALTETTSAAQPASAPSLAAQSSPAAKGLQFSGNSRY